MRIMSRRQRRQSRRRYDRRDNSNAKRARSAGVVTLKLSSRPSTSSGRAPSRSIAIASSVTSTPSASAASSARPSCRRRNSCGGQRAPQAFARLGAVDATVVAGTLERVAHGCGEDRADRIHAAALKQGIEVGGMQIRARRVVHQHEVVGTHRFRQRLQARQHRGRARVTTGCTQQRLAMQHGVQQIRRVVSAEHQHDTTDTRMSGQRVERMRKQAAPTDLEKLLGHVAAEPRAAPCGRHDHPRTQGVGSGASSCGASGALSCRRSCARCWASGSIACSAGNGAIRASSTTR